jgi:hypothetical protein
VSVSAEGSTLWLVGENRFKIVAVDYRLIPSNLDSFGNKSLSGATLDLYDDVQRLGDICLDCGVRYFYATLQTDSGFVR